MIKLADELASCEKYFTKIKKMVETNSEALTIDINDLDKEMSSELLNSFSESDAHKYIQNACNSILYKEWMKEKGTFIRGKKEIYIQYVNVPTRKKIREITSDDIGKLISVNGIIISVSSPSSIIKKATFRCINCNDNYIKEQTTDILEYPSQCACGGKKFRVVEKESIWDNYQKINIQENPDDTQEGVIPRTMEVALLGSHLTDKCKPGDVVNLTCFLKTRQKKYSTIFDWILIVNNVEAITKDAFSIQLEEKDIEEIKKLSSEPRIRDILIKSIFPSIYGWNEEKYGLTLCLFGGVEKKLTDITFRGQSNCLLLGDPGTAKTVMIQAASKVAPKALYTQAGGSSGVGLTASARKDGDQWILEAGAVVLTNGGLCCIDELDKMDEDDREKMHECMEVQTVTIHKANIHTTLNAKTSILAAANPKFGRYDPRYTLAENINLPPTILSRFDLIFIMRDIADKEKDLSIADTIFGNISDEETRKLPFIDNILIKKYILYAKTIKPKMRPEATKALTDFYTDIRSQSYDDERMPIAMTARQLQGLIRLSQANAKMGLRDSVELEDAEIAIELVSNMIGKISTDPETGRLDSSIIETGKSQSVSTKEKILLDMIPLRPKVITRTELCARLADQIDEFEIDKMLKSFTGKDSPTGVSELSPGIYLRYTGTSTPPKGLYTQKKL